MADIKLTKTELRHQQAKLNQLQKYLPTLQLRKAMLQIEVGSAKAELLSAEKVFHLLNEKALDYRPLLEETASVDLQAAVQVLEIQKRLENIAGVQISYFEKIFFKTYDYSLVDSPAWVDSLIEKLKELKVAEVKIAMAQEKKKVLEHELSEVSLRVNLFEKILIPRLKKAIKKIKVFLGDQELAAVSRAKVAKDKILCA